MDPSHREITPQEPWYGGFDSAVRNHFIPLNEIVSGVGIDREKVNTVIELGSGQGAVAMAATDCFPNAVVHPVDIHDFLHTSVKSHERIKFHKVLIVDFLKKHEVPSDITILWSSSSNNGIDGTNVDLLARQVGNGYLITAGDNGDIELKPWFRKRFLCIFQKAEQYHYLDLGAAWVVQKEKNNSDIKEK